METKIILFPTDFSEYNNAALRYASSLAAETGAMLYILHVDEMKDIVAALGEGGYPYAELWNAEEQHQIRMYLSKIVPTVPGVKFDYRYLRGSPVSEILDFAEHEGVDLIVMGSHGRTGLVRLLMGSVAEGVMRRAKCPVLVVKQSIGEAERAEQVTSPAAQK